MYKCTKFVVVLLSLLPKETSSAVEAVDFKVLAIFGPNFTHTKCSHKAMQKIYQLKILARRANLMKFGDFF